MKHIKLYEGFKEDIDIFEEEDWNEKDMNNDSLFKGHEGFYDFLINNNCLDNWIDNMVNFDNNIEKCLNNYKRNFGEKYKEYINSSFTWDYTNEGQEYWENIYDNNILF
jgi:hypothetical protein